MSDNNLSVVITAETQALQTELRRTEQTIQQLNARLVAVGQNGAGFAQLESQIHQAEAEANRLRQAISTMPAAPGALRTSFSEALGSASSLNTGVSTLGGTIGALVNPVTLATGAIIGGSVALGALGANAVNSAIDLEKTKLGMAALVNATTQFYDANGKALSPQDNLNASVAKGSELYAELRKQAVLLADLETSDLTSAASVSLPTLSGAGITDPKQQAELIGTVTAAIKQLNIAQTDMEAKNETKAFLSGDVGNANAEFLKLIASVNGGTEAFKKNYEEAQKNGTLFQFLTKATADFRNSSELSASTASNKFSILNDSLGLVVSTLGEGMLPAFKELQDNAIGQFWEENTNGSDQFNESILNTAESVGVNFGKAFELIEPLVKPIFDLILASLELIGNAVGAFVEATNSSSKEAADGLSSIVPVIDFIGERIGGFVKIAVGNIQIISNVSRAVAGATLGVFETMGNNLISIFNGIGKAFAFVFNGVATGINALGGNISKLDTSKSIPKLDFVKKMGLDPASIKAGFKQAGANVSAGIGEVFKGRQAQSLKVKPIFDTSNLTAKAKGGGADPEKEKKARGGKKGPSAESLAKKADAAMDKAKDLEVAKEKLKLAQDEALENKKLLEIKSNIFNIENSLNIEKTKLKSQDAQLDHSNSQLDLANQALDLEKKKVEVQFSSKQITEQQKIAQIAQIDKQKVENDYAKDLNEIKQKGLTIDTKKLENQAEINKKAQLEAQNAIEETKARKELGFAKNAIDKQKTAISQAKTGEEKVKLQTELTKLEETYLKVEQKLNELLLKNQQEVAKVAATIANNEAEINNLISAQSDEKTKASSTFRTKQSEIDVSAESDLNESNQKRAKDLQEALESGGKEIFDKIKGAFDDGKITMEEAWEIGETVFKKAADIFKAFQGGEGGSGGGGFFSAIGGLFKGGKGKSGGGGSDGGTFDGTNWLNKAGSIIPDPNGGGGGAGGLMSMFGGAGGAAGPAGAIFSGLSTAFSIGSSIMGFFKAKKAKKKEQEVKKKKEDYERIMQQLEFSFQDIQKSIERRLETVNDELKDFSKKASRVISEGNYSIGKLDLSNSLLSMQKAIGINQTSIGEYQKNIAQQIGVIDFQINGGFAQDRDRQLAVAMQQREVAFRAWTGPWVSDEFSNNAVKDIQKIDRETIPAILEQYRKNVKDFTEQKADLIQGSADQVRDLKDQIGKYAEQIGQSVMGFNSDVDFSGYDKAVRGIGQAVAEVIKKGSDLLEGGFDQSKVKTLIENNLKDIQETELGNLDTAVNTAVENRKTWLSDRIKQFSDAIAGITEKFGFKKADTADREIEREFKKFQKERMLQEADLVKQQEEAMKNKASGQAVFNNTIAQQMGIVNQKAIAGSTQDYYKAIGQSITPSADGLQQASSILSQAMQNALDTSLKQVVSAIR